MKFKQFLGEKKNSKKITVFFDMDGVLADWEGKFAKHFGTERDPWTIPDKEMWPMVKNVDNYWEDLEFMKDTQKVWDYAKKNANIEILSGYSNHDKRSIPGKKTWLKKHKDKLGTGFKINLVRAFEKADYANENAILIDDLEKNIKAFREKGGKAILFKNATQALKELKRFL
jgi:5'-nucleotidase